MKIIVYRRVSTDEQADSRNGLNAQVDACQRWAIANGATITASFADEGISGAAGIAKRPGLLQAIQSLGKGDVLLVAKRDRLGRDALVLAMIESAVSRVKARIVSVAGEGTDGDDPASILMRRMIDGFAEYERLIIGARTKAALQAKKARGQRVGTVPFGHDLGSDGRTLTPNADEQTALAWMRQLRAQGLSFRNIGAELSGLGIKPKRALKWSAQSIKQILNPHH